MTRKTRITTFFLAAGIAATGLVALAGDLNPPVGPVAPTQRTPVNANMTPGDADSLFKITQRGSYYLTGNITGVAAEHGIEITASGVTLDLNGFDLLGVAGSLDGVSTTVAGLTNLAVINGSVRNWGDEGVDLASSGAINCRVEGVLATGNAGNGISNGSGGTVTNCSATANTANGITTGNGSTVTNCSASQNGQSGINTGSGCTISNCSAHSNTGNGLGNGNGSAVSNCSAHSNTGNGIATGIGSTVSNCSAYQNTGGTGIYASSGCTVSNCSANFNTGSGITASQGCTVADCTAQLNTGDGIVCSNSCVIRGNTCLYNGGGGGGGDGAGIHATSSENRIEGNNCTSADRGIDVDGAGNFIIRNTCSGNTTNWDIAANNVFGPIEDATAPGSAAVLGNSAPSSLGSTHANANFSY